MTETAAVLGALPERIELDDGVVIRTYTAEDIPHLVDVVNDNLDHLRPWMPWAQEPATIEAQTAWWRGSREPRDDGGADLPYGVYDVEGRLLGGTGFHARSGPGVLEIGYWLAADATGRELMTRVAAALVDVARRIDGVRRVEIQCDQANERSAAIPRRLGFRLVAVEAREAAAAAETGQHQIWALDVG